MEYRIGDFALITQMTIKTLRKYHEEEILIPSRVDSINGYRYYDENLITRTRAIKKLREWNFSLKDIKEILSDFQEDGDLVHMVHKKRKDIQGQIEKLKSIEGELSILLDIEEERKTMSLNIEIVEKEIPSVKIISISYRGEYSECGPYIGKVYKVGGWKAAGYCFNRYTLNEEGDPPLIEVCLPVKAPISHKDVEFKELPPVKVLSTIHNGSYDRLGEAYQRLIDYRNEKGLECSGPYREHYIKGPGMVFKRNPEKYITEVQMPI